MQAAPAVHELLAHRAEHDGMAVAPLHHLPAYEAMEGAVAVARSDRGRCFTLAHAHAPSLRRRTMSRRSDGGKVAQAGLTSFDDGDARETDPPRSRAIASSPATIDGEASDCFSARRAASAPPQRPAAGAAGWPAPPRSGRAPAPAPPARRAWRGPGGAILRPGNAPVGGLLPMERARPELAQRHQRGKAHGEPDHGQERQPRQEAGSPAAPARQLERGGSRHSPRQRRWAAAPSQGGGPWTPSRPPAPQARRDGPARRATIRPASRRGPGSRPGRAPGEGAAAGAQARRASASSP